MIHKKTTDQLRQERPSLETLHDLPRTPISIVADNLRSLDNVGLLFRLAEVARLEKLYLTGYTGYPRTASDNRPENIIIRHDHRIRKTAVYAIPHQPCEYQADPIPVIQHLKKQGSMIVALEQTKQSQPYNEIQYNLPVVLIVGHERQGVRSELLELADHIVEIPILGLGNSHNAAIATSIVLYHILEKAGQV